MTYRQMAEATAPEMFPGDLHAQELFKEGLPAMAAETGMDLDEHVLGPSGEIATADEIEIMKKAIAYGYLAFNKDPGFVDFVNKDYEMAVKQHIQKN
jgi:hypothetical protein